MFNYFRVFNEPLIFNMVSSAQLGIPRTNSASHRVQGVTHDGITQTDKDKEITMGSNDFFKNRTHRHNSDQGYYSGHQENHYGGFERYSYLFEKLKNNKKLLIVLIAVVAVMGIIAIAVIIMFIPLLMKLFGTVQKSGLSGLIDSAKPLLDLIWGGTGK